MANRNYRLAGEIKRDLTDIFAHEIRDPHIDSMVSVTDVEVSNDLSYARIYVSKLGSDKEREAMLAGKSERLHPLAARPAPENPQGARAALFSGQFAGIWREDRKDPWRIRRLIRAKSI